ncbi:MAG: hypothetical protein BA874_13100 [Desulfuromonadales bacterium C00003068]|jgi:uncharacterized protein (DUF2267 family)|nr:MAG: hypothetical protein BA874_13100 [Desulfuromonadales bacterium C00003068]
MSVLGLKVFDETMQLTHTWLNVLMEKTGWDNKQRVYRLLRSVLQATRDHLSVNEAADLGAQLPMLIRGIYYEGWNPARTPVKIRSQDEFIGVIQKDFETDPMGDAEDAIGAVFALLFEKVSNDEMENVRQTFTKEIRTLFPS